MHGALSLLPYGCPHLMCDPLCKKCGRDIVQHWLTARLKRLGESMNNHLAVWKRSSVLPEIIELWAKSVTLDLATLSGLPLCFFSPSSSSTHFFVCFCCRVVLCQRGKEKGFLTCALFYSRAFLQGVAAEFAIEIVFPELCKPDISPVVLQRSADEVAIKSWGGQKESCHLNVSKL